MALPAPGARAACLESNNPDILALQKSVGRDPAEAERKARTLLEQNPQDAIHAAWIGSIIAESNGRRSLPDAAFQSASGYWPLAAKGDAALRAELLWLMATNLPPAANIDEIEADIRGELDRAEPTSPITACLLIARSEIERRRGHHEKMIGDLVRAYTIGRRTPDSPHHIEAMRLGARMMASAEDVGSALEMNARVIASERAHKQDFMLGFAYGFRAIYLNKAGRYRDALSAADIAQRAAHRAGDEMAPLYIGLQNCLSNIGLGRLVQAERQCLPPYRHAGQLTVDGQARASRLLGQIALAQGDTRKALRFFDEAIRILSPHSPSGEQVDTYRLRSQAYRRLGRYPAALADLDRYIALRTASDARLSDRRLTLLRTRMSVDMELSRTEGLTRALEAERALLNEQRNRWFLIAAVAVVVALLIARILMSERRNRRRLHILAHTDNLTGALNRRGILDFAEEAWTREKAKSGTITLAMIDIDHFKAINDAHGHGVGDRVLAQLVATARVHLPRGCEIGRWGGEEFLLALPRLDSEAATELVDTIRADAMAAISGLGFPVPFSAGIADLCDEEDIEAMVARADAALYEAKRAGRNRTSQGKCGARPLRQAAITAAAR